MTCSKSFNNVTMVNGSVACMMSKRCGNSNQVTTIEDTPQYRRDFMMRCTTFKFDTNEDEQHRILTTVIDDAVRAYKGCLLCTDAFWEKHKIKGEKMRLQTLGDYQQYAMSFDGPEALRRQRESHTCTLQPHHATAENLPLTHELVCARQEIKKEDTLSGLLRKQVRKEIKEAQAQAKVARREAAAKRKADKLKQMEEEHTGLIEALQAAELAKGNAEQAAAEAEKAKEVLKRQNDELKEKDPQVAQHSEEYINTLKRLGAEAVKANQQLLEQFREKGAEISEKDAEIKKLRDENRKLERKVEEAHKVSPNQRKSKQAKRLP